MLSIGRSTCSGSGLISDMQQKRSGNQTSYQVLVEDNLPKRLLRVGISSARGIRGERTSLSV